MTEQNKWAKVELSPTWKYESEGPGSSLIGVLTKIETDIGPNASKLYTLQKENGEFVSVWGSTVLDARLGNIVIGEEVMINYLGKAKGQKGKKDYHNFEVFHRSIEPADIVFPE
jgi:hypothetical protein